MTVTLLTHGGAGFERDAARHRVIAMRHGAPPSGPLLIKARSVADPPNISA